VAGALARGRREEALALNPDTISTACPYCLVMLGDAPDTLEVVDVAHLLARSVRPQHDGVASPNSAAAD
jgi:Fe-S oxidoreductase